MQNNGKALNLIKIATTDHAMEKMPTRLWTACQIIILHNKLLIYYYSVYYAAKRDTGVWLMSLHATTLAFPEYCL